MQLGQYELESTTTNWEVSSHKHKYALLSFLGKLDYGYKEVAWAVKFTDTGNAGSNSNDLLEAVYVERRRCSTCYVEN